MTLSCHAWLAADFLTSRGFRLEVVDGRRWAVRGFQQFEIDPVCGCGPDVCPPHETTYVSREIAA